MTDPKTPTQTECIASLLQALRAIHDELRHINTETFSQNDAIRVESARDLAGTSIGLPPTGRTKTTTTPTDSAGSMELNP